ncbi:MAG: DNA polymerase/3'-5' exonuclease PolX [Saprospiraceae bacterium]|nr:DNA polymerase/3'-5' exonuclease PolX [Saprospiraceae bacterium]
MTNKEIAAAFNRLAKIMELHGENTFKIRSYQNAYVLLRKWPDPLETMSLEALEGIQGVGKAIAEKIRELVDTGTLATYLKYAEQTPPGVIEMLEIPGIGPKKVLALWKELGIETTGELLYACNENRLIALNGFGVKTQADLRDKLQFFLQSKNQWIGPNARQIAHEAIEELRLLNRTAEVIMTGELRRHCPIVSQIELLWIVPDDYQIPQSDKLIPVDDVQFDMPMDGKGTVRVHLAHPGNQGRRLWETTGSEGYVKRFAPNGNTQDESDETNWLHSSHLPVHPPEWREDADQAIKFASRTDKLIEEKDIRGVIHAHSTWSDGVQRLEEMARTCKQKGYEYLVISDHSRSAFYANGLQPNRVIEQFAEIDRLNTDLAPFRIFKGIESDILHNGELDYEPDLLARFEVVIASIHSNLRMDADRAMLRLLNAIANPATRILGHPTGRLLLSRAGYPIDYRKVIEACATHGVAIELNANPQRLDLDYSWIPFAMECNVQIAVNPDAHSTTGIDDIRTGVFTARKGGLTVGSCLNTKSLAEFEKWTID